MATEKANITIVLTNPFLLIVYGVLTGMAFIAVENFDSTNKDDLTLAIVEPKTPYTDDEVMEFLKNSNASEFFQIAPGFISAKIPVNLVPKIKNMATVTEKSIKSIKS